MIYWIESIKDGSFVAGTKTYEEALAIQDKKLKEGIGTHIKKINTEGIESTEELLKKLKEQDFFKNLTRDSLKCLDNIVDNIAELKKMSNGNLHGGSMYIWLLFLMLLFGNSFKDSSLNVSRIEDSKEINKDETDKA